MFKWFYSKWLPCKIAPHPNTGAICTEHFWTFALKKKYNIGTFITLYFRQKATCSYSVDETFLKSQNYSVSSSVNQVNGKVE